MTEQANAVRGEISITLDADYVLRPSYDAIVAIEERTGRGLLALARSALRGELPLGDTAIVVAECIKAEGRSIGRTSLAGVKADAIGRLIMQAGHVTVLGTVSTLLTLATSGGYSPEGELQAAAVTKPESLEAAAA